MSALDDSKRAEPAPARPAPGARAATTGRAKRLVGILALAILAASITLGWAAALLWGILALVGLVF